jgi:hypothetical protein
MFMSDAAWVVSALHILVIIWVVVIDEFVTIKKWYEKYFWLYLPKVFKSGASWITWIVHGLVAVLITAYFASWALILPESLIGSVRLGSAVALVFYAVREFMNWRHHVRNKDSGKWSVFNGWGFDGIMDMVGPTVVHLWTWMF